MRFLSTKIRFLFIIIPLLISIHSTCYAQSSLSPRNSVPYWIKIKFYQSYGYSWDQASLEQRAKFVEYCERMKEQWKQEDKQYEKTKKLEDKRFKEYVERKKNLRKYLEQRAKIKKKKQKLKEKQQASQLKQLRTTERILQKTLERLKKSQDK